jgi:uncharacterized membrane protein YhaH (DUF805 family)
MNFAQAVKAGFSNCLNFNARTTRWDYVCWLLFWVLGGYAASLIDSAVLHEATRFGAVNIAFNVIVLLPTVAGTVRRLHDTGRSGWWLLIVPGVTGAMTAVAIYTGYFAMPLIVIFAGLGILIYWLRGPGTPGPNRFGPRPTGFVTITPRPAT